MLHSRKVYGVGLGIAVGWLLWILAAPWLLATGHFLPALISYRVFSLVCHQQVERSFTLLNFSLGVCARCLGIYAGGFVGWLCAPWGPAVQRKWALLAVMPMLFDWLAGVSGLWVNTLFSRLMTGMLAGSVVACCLWPVIVRVAHEVSATHSGERIFHDRGRS